uniref:Uncharacterized protein n=1 Tax=Glossina brevipalpis TaxID=37001 RepID=A0A1A9WKJ3_9MUSC
MRARVMVKSTSTRSIILSITPLCLLWACCLSRRYLSILFDQRLLTKEIRIYRLTKLSIEVNTFFLMSGCLLAMTEWEDTHNESYTHTQTYKIYIKFTRHWLEFNANNVRKKTIFVSKSSRAFYLLMLFYWLPIYIGIK